MEMCCGCEMENLYTVIGVDEQSKSNEKLFTLKEDSNCCLRQWCLCIYCVTVFFCRLKQL